MRAALCVIQRSGRALRSPTARANSVWSHKGIALSMKADKVLVSFDVDGTLIHSVGHNANKLHKEAFAAAFKQVYGIDTSIDVVQHHGSTDPLILLKVLEHHGVARSEALQRLQELKQAMVDHFLAHRERAGEGLEILPGVVGLLEALGERDDVAICLVTGNLEPIGWAKMAALGIEHLFTRPLFGGFGSDFCSGNVEESWRDRAELVRIAAKRAEEGLGAPLRARYHVGDAPMDVQAAEAAGARAIGVTTGIYTKQELEAAAKSAIVLTGVDDLRSVLAALSLHE